MINNQKDADATITGSTFKNTINGGAINNNGVLSIIDSTFTNNNGEAVYNTGKATIESSTFTNNKVNSNGGAIYNNNELTITDSTFTGNTANNGGAIYNAGSLTITGSEFNTNTAKVGGGAIYSINPVTIDSTTFYKNSVTNTNKQAQGGAIYLSNAKGMSSITNSKFKYNSAYSYGGAIRAYNSDLTISDSDFFGNTLSNANNIGASDGLSRGGAINSADATLLIYNSNFENNMAGDAGAAIRTNGTVVVDNCNFTNNGLYETSTGMGSAIFCNNGDSVTISNSNFDNTKYTNGFVYAIGTEQLYISNSNFTSSKKILNQAVYADNVINSKFNNVIINGMFKNGLEIIGGSANIDNVDIDVTKGNAIYLANVKDSSITNSNLKASNYGIYIYSNDESSKTISTSSNIKVDNCNISATYSAVRLEAKGNDKISDVTLSNLKLASTGDSGIYAIADNSGNINNLNIENVEINKVPYYAIYLKNVNDFNILNSIITNNGKLVSSNAIYLANCKDGNIKYNNISNNKGTGINSFGSNNVNIIGNTITNNGYYGI